MSKRILYVLGAAAVSLLVWFGSGTGSVLTLLALAAFPAFVLFVAAARSPAFFKHHPLAARYAFASALVALAAVGWTVSWFAFAPTAPLYLLPAGYTGPALVVYGQEDGAPERYEEGRRVYAIPDSGVLRTRFAPDEGWRSGLPAFAYVDGRGRRRALPYFDGAARDARAEARLDTFASNIVSTSTGESFTCDAPASGYGGATTRYAQFHISPFDDSTEHRLRRLEATLPPPLTRRPAGCP